MSWILNTIGHSVTLETKSISQRPCRRLRPSAGLNQLKPIPAVCGTWGCGFPGRPLTLSFPSCQTVESSSEMDLRGEESPSQTWQVLQP